MELALAQLDDVAHTTPPLAARVIGLEAYKPVGAELERRVGELSLDPGPARQILAERERLASVEPPRGLSAGQAAGVRNAVASSFHAGYRAVAYASGILALCAVLCSWKWIARDDVVKRRLMSRAAAVAPR